MTTFYITKRSGQRIRVTLSDEDSDLVEFKWHMAGGKKIPGEVALGEYAARRVGITTVYLHRVVAHRMGLVTAVIGTGGGNTGNGSAGGTIDHIDGNKTNNRRSNLALKNQSQQMLNLNDGLRSTNRSGYRGVSFVKMRERWGKPWMAYVQVNYKSKNLGWYATALEAAAARRAWDQQNE